MRAALTAVCGLTALESSWLFIMFLVLRHPGFEGRASVAALLGVMSLAILIAAQRRSAGGAVRALVVAGSLALGALGIYAIATNHQAAHFEGYLDVIGLSFAAQGVLGTWWGVRS